LNYLDLKITFQANEQTEFNRILLTISTLTSNRGILNYYYITDSKAKQDNTFIVPEFAFFYNQEFRKMIDGKGVNMYPLNENLNNLWDKLSSVDKKNIEISCKKALKSINQKKIINQMQKAHKFIANILIGHLNFNEIVIFPTCIGSPASFYFYKRKLYLYFRADRDISEIASVYLQKIFRDVYLPSRFSSEENYFLSGKWAVSKSFADFFLLKTKLAKLFTNYKKFHIFEPSEVPALDMKKSQKLLEKYRIFYIKPLKLEDDQIMLFDKPFKLFSKHENILLRYLLHKEGTICSFDEIYEVLWEDKYTSKYSIYYLPKLVYKIRKALKTAGLHRNIIFVSRGKGYTVIQ